MEQTLRNSISDAIRFWEPCRLLYNLILAAIVLLYFWIGLPHSKEMLNANAVMGLFILAVIANVAYCAAYLADIFAQMSLFSDIWRRLRWVLFATGTVFAAIFARFVAMAAFGVMA